MRIGILINDSEYREALVDKLSSYDNDLFVNIISNSEPVSKDCLILTDIRPETIESSLLNKLIPRTVFLTTTSAEERNEKSYHSAFKYSSVPELLSEMSIVYKDWHGIGYGRDHSAKIIAVCSENDAAAADSCMALARQILYKRGGKVLVIGLGYINDHGHDEPDKINRFARLMYTLSTGRGDASFGFTSTDSYGVSTLMLQNGRNPLAYIEENELMNVITSLAPGFDTLILDIGTCFRKENLIAAENSDSIVYFENGRRYTGIEQILAEEAQGRLIRIRLSGETEDAMVIDDAVNRIYGAENDENFKG